MDISTPRQVGKSSLHVSPFGFGGGTIGNPAVSTSDSFDAVQAAWDVGVRFFDTAPWYGVGRSERRLGMALGDLNQRDHFRVNTKIGKTLRPEPTRDESRKTYCADGSVRTPRDPRTGFRIHFEYTADAIQTQHEASLQRLGLASVDSLTIHDIDYGYHNDDQIEHHLRELDRNRGGGAGMLEQLRDEGKISAIGCGCNLESRNAHSWDDNAHELLCERIADTVDLDFFIIAGAYTLLETRAMRRILPMCEERNIGIIGATPFAGGWLADPENASSYMYGRVDESIAAKTTALNAICDRYDVPLAALALQFQLAHPLMAAIIPGAKSRREVESNHELVDMHIPRDVWNDIKRKKLLNPDAYVPI